MVIFTDGSYSDQTGALGYAFCCVEDEKVVHVSDAFFLHDGSSMIAEIIAVSKSLEYCLQNKISNPLVVLDCEIIPPLAFGFKRCKPQLGEFVERLQKLTRIVEPTFRTVVIHREKVYRKLVHDLAIKAMRRLRDGKATTKKKVIAIPRATIEQTCKPKISSDLVMKSLLAHCINEIIND